MRATEEEGEIGDSQTFVLSYMYVPKKNTPSQAPKSSHQKFIIQEEDKRPSVSSLNKMVNALDCENVNVSMKLGNKKNQ